mmetsp:Transcript_28576/g.48300  ORF Transcript_28576/g.48300 Transcript_28576/m.48300 type:complete len:104 (+) Transcript_28576:3-314(+)
MTQQACEPILWNSALVWFRSRGGGSKRARRALEKAISRSPAVYRFMCGHKLLPPKESPERDDGQTIFMKGKVPQQGTATACTYLELYGFFWRRQEGAVEWVNK